MKKTLLTGAFFGLISAFCLAQPANANISNTIFFNGEPYIAKIQSVYSLTILIKDNFKS